MTSEVSDSKASRRRRGRRLPLWKKLALSTVTTGVFLRLLLTALETGLHFRRMSVGFDGRRGTCEYTWGHKVAENRYGFRERDFSEPKPSGVSRIMVLGDSLTWGTGLAAADRYTNRLEALLHAARPGRRFEVLNFGLRGLPTTRERDIL